MKTTSKNKGNGIDADVSGNRLPFKGQSINNFCGIDISQPTPSESLSVPLFSLDIRQQGEKTEKTVHSTNSRATKTDLFGELL